MSHLCIRVPGAHGLIDYLLPDGGSGENQLALDRARQRHPTAEIVPYADYCAEQAKLQDVPVTWEEIDEERYWYLLECVPPAAMCAGGFLVGEAYDHHSVSGQPRFTACCMIGDRKLVERPVDGTGGVVCTLHQEGTPGSRFFQSNRPVTIAEFRSAEMPRPVLA
jgi:hypothetical protein